MVSFAKKKRQKWAVARGWGRDAETGYAVRIKCLLRCTKVAAAGPSTKDTALHAPLSITPPRRASQKKGNIFLLLARSPDWRIKCGRRIRVVEQSGKHILGTVVELDGLETKTIR